MFTSIFLDMKFSLFDLFEEDTLESDVPMFDFVDRFYWFDENNAIRRVNEF